MTDKNIQGELNDLADKLGIPVGKKNENEGEYDMVMDQAAMRANHPQANQEPNLNPHKEYELILEEFMGSLREHAFRKGMLNSGLSSREGAWN